MASAVARARARVAPAQEAPLRRRPTLVAAFSPWGELLRCPERRGRIAAARQRCAALSRCAPPPAPGPHDAAGTEALQRHAAAPLALLGEQLVGSGCAALLADAGGRLLEVWSDATTAAGWGELGLREGADWSEAACGTNAVGTALATDAALLVLGDEHHLHALDGFGGAGAPVHDPSGRRAGAVALYARRDALHPHSFALVRTTAALLETAWCEAQSGRAEPAQTLRHSSGTAVNRSASSP